jgi:hypothetical protein
VTQREIFTAAHRQAARLVCPGLMSYRQAFAIALRQMHAAARANVLAQSGGYAGYNFATIRRDAARDAIGIPVG